MRMTIIKTFDGSHTLYVPELDEHYHSIHGAVKESEYVFIRNGFEYCKSKSLVIFETGFGTGLNVLLTALRSAESNIKVLYYSIEKYPLSRKIVDNLNYPEYIGGNSADIFGSIHSCSWGTVNKIYKDFSLFKIKGDMATFIPDFQVDLIYFDAFGPDKQPEMWSSEIFSTISGITHTGSLFVTYSSKGAVKRNLRTAGFSTELLPGPPGKRHILRATKI